MAHKKDYKPEDIMFPEQHIVQSELVHEMKSSYIDYAMSVIVGRALPDVRDGLKPVHRRILYAMYEDGLTSDKPFKKSATCVGDVLGRYHPHGDASVYDAMVRLAQDFSMRYPLIDGHGNFGSVDGDPPAAISRPARIRTPRSGRRWNLACSTATACIPISSSVPTPTATAAAPPCRTAGAATGSFPATRWA